MRIERARLLQVLARYDVATVEDLTQSFGQSARRSVWLHLQKATAQGLVERDGDRGAVARYRLTDAGKAQR